DRPHTNHAIAFGDSELNVRHALSIWCSCSVHDEPRAPHTDRHQQREVHRRSDDWKSCLRPSDQSKVCEIDQPIECYDAEPTGQSDERPKHHQRGTFVPVAPFQPGEETLEHAPQVSASFHAICVP